MRKPTGSSRGAAGRLITVTLLFCLLQWAPSSAARPRAPALEGTNIITGSSTKAMSVRIPSPATVNLGSGRGGITIQGGGRLAGIVLSRADLDNPGRPVLVALRYSICEAKGCNGASRALFVGDDIVSPENVRLPAGEYILYLVADRRRATVTLPLQGIAGTASLKPNTPVHSAIDTPPVTIGGEEGAPIYSSGQTVDFRGESSLWATILHMEGDAWVAGKYGHCIYRGDAPPPPVGFAPNCPGGSDAAFVDAIVQPFAYEKAGGALTLASAGGVWGFGDYYEAVAVTGAPTALAFYLDFETI